MVLLIWAMCTSGIHSGFPERHRHQKSRQTFCGGKGLNQSIALAKAGIPVYHAGLIGEAANHCLKYVKENGVNARVYQADPGPCGHTVIPG